ncbi:response regulator [Halomonas sp. HNIBRBA4712]|uniref:response regulator n=1 Tax=Halomonas sp. HNIBRBA4712 TaxID=3373087 RepID=UPI003745807F
MTILVVDDDVLAAELTAAILTAQGYVPMIAHNAMEAVRTLEAHSDIALIVSDLTMPLVSGLELHALLRDQGVMIPFILLTGDDTVAALAEAPYLHACLQKQADLALTLGPAVDQALGS